MSSHYILYWSPGSVSMIPHWLLRVLEPQGVTFELRRIDFMKNETHTADHLRLNPMGQIPVLIYDGDQAMSETIGIAMFLAERHPAARLAPPANAKATERAEYLQTMVRIANTMMSSQRAHSWATQDAGPGNEGPVIAMAERKMAAAWNAINSQMQGRKYVLGGQEPSVADYALVALARWSHTYPKSPMDFPSVARLVNELGKTEAYQETCDAEGIDKWPVEG